MGVLSLLLSNLSGSTLTVAQVEQDVEGGVDLVRPGRRLRSAARPLLGVAAMVALSACGSSPSASPASIPTSLPASAPTDAPVPQATGDPSGSPITLASPTPGPLRLAIGVLPWRLDVGLSRAVAFADGGTIVLAGGLTANGTTGQVRQIDVATGRLGGTGRLPRSVHDGSGAVMGGHLLLFGGGSTVAGRTVQLVSPGTTGTIVGSLPAARADLSTVVVGDRVYVVGGGSSGAPDARIWATADGTSARLVGRLQIGVRYAAVAASGSSIFVFGGATSSGDRDEIQRFDTTTGQTTVVGRLPVRVSHAAAMVLAGRILVMGGGSNVAIWSFDPALAAVKRVGRLPYRESDAAAVVVGGRGYLIGGEDPAFLDTVISVDVQ